MKFNNTISRGVLHCHTQYSRFDSAMSVKTLLNTAYSLGAPAVMLSDHGTGMGFEEARIIMEKNKDKSVDGIIVQLPIPDKYDVRYIQKFIDKSKDVDGFRRDSLFTPCTPKGIIDYLTESGIEFAGKVCTVIGRSEIVGKPLVNLLIDRGATVVSCNSKTVDIRKYTKSADIVISAIGRAKYFDSTYFTEGQILVDVGINRDAEGKLCGDIAEEAKESALLATPVPNGVGLLTRLALLENTLEAYRYKN